MVYHFPSAREVCYNTVAGNTILPPEGWYFEGIVSISGANPPFNGPLEVTRRQLLENDLVLFGNYSLARTHFSVPVLSLHLGLQPDLLDVCLDPAEISAALPETFIVMSIRPNTKFKVAPLSSLSATDQDVIVTEYWSVAMGTSNPTLRETYFPAIRIADSLKQLFEQNESLKETGHELMVRYYKYV